jgi:ArsR family transcriptional regulator, arsenate/arsenite/antimonite-responsive transcriptional repressor
MRASYARAIPRPWRRTATLFVALGDPHRQRILLMFEPAERLRVGDIVAASTLSRTAVAHHLRVMREAGVLRCEKIGKEVWYWPDTEAVRSGLRAVLDYMEGM